MIESNERVKDVRYEERFTLEALMPFGVGWQPTINEGLGGTTFYSHNEALTAAARYASGEPVEYRIRKQYVRVETIEREESVTYAPDEFVEIAVKNAPATAVVVTDSAYSPNGIRAAVSNPAGYSREPEPTIIVLGPSVQGDGGFDEGEE